MPYDPFRHHRRSIRLRGYDYSRPGFYFVTICSWQRRCIFGEVTNGVRVANELGAVANEAWRSLPRHYRHVELDEMQLMPNHVHANIVLLASGQPLSEVIRAFKTMSAKRINTLRGTPGAAVWQRNYYERVVRDAQEIEHARRYTRDNPLHWHDDPENAKR